MDHALATNKRPADAPKHAGRQIPELGRGRQHEREETPVLRLTFSHDRLSQRGFHGLVQHRNDDSIHRQSPCGYDQNVFSEPGTCPSAGVDPWGLHAPGGICGLLVCSSGAPVSHSVRDPRSPDIGARPCRASTAHTCLTLRIGRLRGGVGRREQVRPTPAKFEEARVWDRVRPLTYGRRRYAKNSGRRAWSASQFVQFLFFHGRRILAC